MLQTHQIIIATAAADDNLALQSAGICSQTSMYKQRGCTPNILENGDVHYSTLVYPIIW